MKFVGWTPTAVGRLSFSRIGAHDGNHRARVCNRTALDDGYMFGAERKKSPDGPLHAWLLPNRIHHAHYLTFLKVAPEALPTPTGDLPDMQLDKRGSVTGTVLIVLAKRRSPAWFFRRVSQFDERTRRANSSENPLLLQSTAAEAEADIHNMWDSLQDEFYRDPRKSPAFAKASVTLCRTGKTTISVDPNDLFVGYEAKVQHFQKGRGKKIPSALLELECRMIARHVFHFIRDMTHRHYHHDPQADLATTVYPADKDDDTWRRETHYALVRMAVSSRREDDTESYKQSLGILAYAESFQTHLASWRLVGASPRKRLEYFPYDFSALRQSIDASMQALESRFSRSSEGRTFVFVTILTALGLVLAGGQALGLGARQKACIGELAACEFGGGWFWAMVSVATLYPWQAILLPTVGALLIAISTRRLGKRSTLLKSWRGGVGRFTDAVMGETSRYRDPRLAWLVGILAVSTISLGLLWSILRLVDVYFALRSLAISFS